MFHTLDYDARIERLNTLAHDALSEWGLAGASLDLITDANNAVYKVTDGDDGYTLRIHRPNHKPLSQIKAEITWLKAIKSETSLCVPEPLRPIYEGQMDGVDSPMYCVLFGWLDGEFFQEQSPTLEFVNKVGRFAGELHNFSARYTPPNDVIHTHLDWGGLFGKQSKAGTASQYDPKAGDKHFTNDQRNVMQQGAEKVREVMQALGQSPETYGLIHADLIIKNVMLNNAETICALDFDDSSYGYYLYDLAPMLLNCKQESNFVALRQSLWDGYTRVRPQPAPYFEYLETLIAARHIASCRWIAGNADNPSIKGRVAEILEYRIARLAEFVETGEMNP